MVEVWSAVVAWLLDLPPNNNTASQLGMDNPQPQCTCRSFYSTGYLYLCLYFICICVSTLSVFVSRWMTSATVHIKVFLLNWISVFVAVSLSVFVSFFVSGWIHRVHSAHSNILFNWVSVFVSVFLFLFYLSLYLDGRQAATLHIFFSSTCFALQ